MTTEESARFEVLLENVQRDMRVIAEGHGALNERLDRIEVKVDGLKTNVDGLEMKVDALAGYTQGRLKRIEAHLKLNGSSPGPKATSNPTPKRRKKS